MCFSKPNDEESGKSKKLKKRPCAVLKHQSLRTMNAVKARTTMLPATFRAQHFLISLLFIYQILAHSASSETVHESCPSRCTCENPDEFIGLSVACNNLELTDIPVTPSAPSVQSLDLSRNSLTHTREFAFKDYSSVHTLSLSDNQINDVDSRAFYGLRKLRNIDLSNNNLQFINGSMFSDNPVLQTVSFKKNPLVYVPDSAPILASHSVTSLDLSFCSLTSLNSHSLSQLPSLQILDLSSNNLQELHQDILNPLTGLIVVNFSSNRWKCDCDIVEVLNWLSERRKSRELEGEHRPVKCFDAGVYKTIWMAADKNKFCNKQTQVLSETIPQTELSTILEGTEENEATPTTGNILGDLFSWNANTILVFVILPLLLGVVTFVTLIAVNWVNNCINSRRQTTVSPVTKNGNGNSMRRIYSRIPFLTPKSFDSAEEKWVTASSLSSDDGSYAHDPYALYETVE